MRDACGGKGRSPSAVAPVVDVDPAALEFFITDRGMTPSYVVYLLLGSATADSQDLPDAVTNGIYDNPP
jgi:hypothetical protein